MKKFVTLAILALFTILLIQACKKSSTEIVDNSLAEKSIAIMKDKIPKDGVPITIATKSNRNPFFRMPTVTS